MNIIIILLLMTFLSTSNFAGKCTCKKAEETETTNWGWIINRSITEAGIVKVLRGRILDVNGKPVENALVEVFDHPEIALSENSYQNRDKENRLAACKTGANGEFCFTGIPAGKYEVRGSALAFDASRVIVTLAPKNKLGSNKGIEVVLEVSQ